MKEGFGRQVMNKNIWIDLTNSPHVLFFKGIIKRLIDEGNNVTVTARDYAQTLPLLNEYNIKYIHIGKHMGKNKFNKVKGLVNRSIELYKFAKNKSFDLALSMGSNDMAFVAYLRGIPHVTSFDYEYVFAHNINFRLATKILKPSVIPFSRIKKYGAKEYKIINFIGLKEDFYIHHHEYRDDYLVAKLGLDPSKVIVTYRPPATQAHYQNNDYDFSIKLLKYIASNEECIIIVVPRTKDQIGIFNSLGLANVIIPNEVLDGYNLVNSSDIVISAGGTMNREAAALNVPVFTIYKGGLMGAVDQYLLDSGKMVELKTEEDFNNIKFIKRIKDLKEVEKNQLDYIQILKTYLLL